MPDYPKSVVIEEQGLRDGLQNEAELVPTDKKIEIIIHTQHNAKLSLA